MKKEQKPRKLRPDEYRKRKADEGAISLVLPSGFEVSVQNVGGMGTPLLVRALNLPAKELQAMEQYDWLPAYYDNLDRISEFIIPKVSVDPKIFRTEDKSAPDDALRVNELSQADKWAFLQSVLDGAMSAGGEELAKAFLADRGGKADGEADLGTEGEPAPK